MVYVYKKYIAGIEPSNIPNMKYKPNMESSAENFGAMVVNVVLNLFVVVIDVNIYIYIYMQ